VWHLLDVALSSILDLSNASLIVGYILVIPIPSVLEFKGTLHHVCSVSLSFMPDAGMTVLLM